MNIFVVPFLISIAFIVIVYMMKKDEPDHNKRPNYPILFVICLGVSSSFAYFMSSSNSSIDVVMKEIHTGEPNF
jgi:hypothetical protein